MTQAPLITEFRVLAAAPHGLLCHAEHFSVEAVDSILDPSETLIDPRRQPFITRHSWFATKDVVHVTIPSHLQKGKTAIVDFFFPLSFAISAAFLISRSGTSPKSESGEASSIPCHDNCFCARGERYAAPSILVPPP